MDDRDDTMQITLYLAWWFQLYAWGVILTAYLCDREPDETKITRMIDRAIRIKVH